MQIPAVSPITLPYRLFGTSQSMHSLSIAGDVTLLMCWASGKAERFCSSSSVPTQTAPAFAHKFWYAARISAPLETQRKSGKLAKIAATKLSGRLGWSFSGGLTNCRRSWKQEQHLFSPSTGHCQGFVHVRYCSRFMLTPCQFSETLALDKGCFPARAPGYTQ